MPELENNIIPSLSSEMEDPIPQLVNVLPAISHEANDAVPIGQALWRSSLHQSHQDWINDQMPSIWRSQGQTLGEAELGRWRAIAVTMDEILDVNSRSIHDPSQQQNEE